MRYCHQGLFRPGGVFRILLVLFAALGAPATAQETQFKRIRDISVACTNALSCDVSTYNSQSELYTVIFRRAASPDAPVRLVLGVRESLNSNSDVIFDVDGVEILRVPVSDLSYRAAVYEYLYKGDAAISGLIAAAKEGRSLRVSFRARGLDTVSVFSLSGFVAGLVFMDEVQGRIGREDALQGATAAPANDRMVRDILRIADIPFQLRAEFSDRESAACGGLSADLFANLGGFEAKSGGDVRLIALPCGSGGAYNQPYAFWERIGSSFRRVPLPVMTDEGPSTAQEAWNISWDQEKQELTGFFKGRGLGDCGVLNRWAWKERTEGHVFILKESRSKDECDGDPAGGPGNWPLVWPMGG
jgi:Protein of unknown function (DUF1176)